MNKIKKMHLDAIKDSYHTYRLDEEDDSIVDTVFLENKAASKSSEITGQIAVEFVRWYENRDKSIDENMLTWEDYYKEFLKTKQ